jgi:hypothetical protein
MDNSVAELKIRLRCHGDRLLSDTINVPFLMMFPAATTSVTETKIEEADG